MFHFSNDPDADGVGVVFTDAVGPDGGVLDLGGAFGSDRPSPGGEVVESALGVTLVTLRQVHGTTVLDVDEANHGRAAHTAGDALVTASRGLGLAVRVADCVPVLFADAAVGLVGAAHAGRVGLAAGVLQATVARLRERGAQELRAWIGPHVCGECYEVPAAMAADLAETIPELASRTRWGTAGLDLGRGARAILAREGIEASVVPGCTLTTPRLHSYRRDGVLAGRQAGVVWLPA